MSYGKDPIIQGGYGRDSFVSQEEADAGEDLTDMI